MKEQATLPSRIPLLAAALLLAALPGGASTTTELQKILASDGSGADYFGSAVSVHGDTALIGAPLDDPSGSDTGSAYVFERDTSGNWTEQAKLTASDFLYEQGGHFGAAVSIHGDTALIAAPRDSSSPGGAVYVYVEASPGIWEPHSKLTASDPVASSGFGRSVSLEGDVALIAAPFDDELFYNAGAVYVFLRDSSGNWSEHVKLTAGADAAEEDRFGNSVSLSGDTALIGAHLDDNAVGINAGAAYVFVSDAGGIWSQQAKLVNNCYPSRRFLGRAVSVSGDTAVIGTGTTACVYDRDAGGGWSLVARLYDFEADSFFGASLSISGDTVLIGARTAVDPSSGSRPGAGYLYGRDASNAWPLVTKLVASDGVGGDHLAEAVALTADTALLGAPRDADNGSNAGAAFIFSTEPPILNQPPTADAGPDQTVDEGSLVVLDGSGSSDPDGDALIFQWTQTAGAAVALDLSDPEHPEFVAPPVPPAGASFTFQLTVSDGELASSDVVNVTVGNLNAAPIAHAGADQTVDEQDFVSLDGSGSGDPDGDSLTFQWQQLAGIPVLLDLTDPVRPTFVAPLVGPAGATLTFQLTVNDGELAASDVVDVAVGNVNAEPTANAGVDQLVDEGELVTLDGSGSTDPDGDPLAFHWQQLAGPVVSLSDPFAVSPTFDAPLVPAGGATLSFELLVDDGELSGKPDLVNITVANVNNPPIADAGANQVVQEASPVALDGSGSFDPDGEGLTFSWLQTAGTLVVLSDPTAEQPAFTAPLVGTSGEALSFLLTVSDGSASSQDAVEIVIENVNQAPIADAGSDQTKNEGALVTLDGTSSSDPDGDALAFSWTQLSGALVVLSDSSSAAPDFVAPPVAASGETLVFELIVDDGSAQSPPDQVAITVLNINDPPACELARASHESLWPPNHKLVQIEITGVADPDNDQVTISVTEVTQDEPIGGSGSGDTSPDAVVGDQVLVRSERAGGGNGRVYQVTFTAEDSAGGTCTGAVSVCVPHDHRGTCVDDGQDFVSTQH